MFVYIIGLILLSNPVSAAVNFKTIYKEIDVEVKATESRVYKAPSYNSLQWRLKGDNDGAITNTIRIEPLAIGQKDHETELIEQRNKLGSAYSSEVNAEKCLDKNLTFLELFYAKDSIKLHHQLKLSYTDLTRVLKRGVKRDILKFNELLNMQETLVETKLKFNELVLRSRSQLAQLDLPRKLKPSKIGSLNFDGFIDVEDIKRKITTIKMENIELSKLGAVARIKHLDYMAEQRKESQVFSHFQVSHKKTIFEKDDAIKNNIADDSFSIEVSFNLPGSSYQNSQGKLIEWQKAQAEYSAARREGPTSLSLNKANLNIKIRNYIDLNSEGYLKDLNSYLDLLKKSSSNSPYKIVQVREKILKQKIKLLDLRYEITKDYLYSLAEQGKLSKCSLSHLTKAN
jgi:hypothetical protein